MEQVLDVLCVVEGREGCGGLVDFLLRAGFARVDPLEDAEAAEVGEGDLELADGLGAGDVVFGLAGGACQMLVSWRRETSMIWSLPFFLIFAMVADLRSCRSRSGKKAIAR